MDADRTESKFFVDTILRDSEEKRNMETLGLGTCPTHFPA